MLKRCLRCSTVVLPMADGVCPSCRNPIGDAPVVQIEASQARYQIEQEERERVMRQWRQRRRSSLYVAILGLVMAIAAVSLSFVVAPASPERLVLRLLGSAGSMVLIVGLTRYFSHSRLPV